MSEVSKLDVLLEKIEIVLNSKYTYPENWKEDAMKQFFPELRELCNELQTELDDSNNRLGWLIDSFNVDWDDVFIGYEEDE